jgi:hypothetical protein
VGIVVGLDRIWDLDCSHACRVRGATFRHSPTKSGTIIGFRISNQKFAFGALSLRNFRAA